MVSRKQLIGLIVAQMSEYGYTTQDAVSRVVDVDQAFSEAYPIGSPQRDGLENQIAHLMHAEEDLEFDSLRKVTDKMVRQRDQLTVETLEQRIRVFEAARSLIHQAILDVRKEQTAFSRRDYQNYMSRLLSLRKDFDEEIAGYRAVIAKVTAVTKPDSPTKEEPHV